MAAGSAPWSPATADPVGSRSAALAVVDASHPPAVQAVAVTGSGGDGYAYLAAGRSVTVGAGPGVHGLNRREVWWPVGAPRTVDAESCLTYAGGSADIGQPGVALRIRQDGDRTRAIAVMDNIWWGYRQRWNVILFDTTATRTHFRVLASIDLSDAFFDDRLLFEPLPWRVCARVLGATVELKAWAFSDRRTEPAWGDPLHTASVALDPSWVYAGSAGWYAGHLPTGTDLQVADLRTWRLSGTPGQPPAVAAALQARAAAEALVDTWPT